MKAKTVTTIEELEKLITKEMEEADRDNFAKQASYIHNGIYSWRGNFSKDTRELFLMGVACRNNIIVDFA